MTQTDDVQAACSGSLLVSIPKSGSHLILKLYGRAGYLQTGDAINPSDDRIPREEMKRNLLRNPAVAALVDRFPALEPDVLLPLLAQHARSESMGIRWEVAPAMHEVWSEIRKLSDETLFLPGLVVSTHLFPWQMAGPRFLDGWRRTGAPYMVYNYRDPRAQIVSMIRFLAESDVAVQHPPALVYRPILRSLGSMDRMLSFAISDPEFPYRNVYRQNRWLLYHPNVLKLRFEDLVGEEGGGSRAVQAAAVERWARFLAVDVPTEQLTRGLFGGTKTFHEGRTDSWRDVFEEHHLRAFEREFGDVLADYGYADD
ncbi:MAG TPA: hypothetical protein VF092_11200 [Longimicrobium sp.]